MLLILNRYRFFLRVCIYTLPLIAFVIAGALLPDIPYQPYQSPVFLLVTAATLAVWGMTAEHYQVCSIDELLREWTGTRGAVTACLTTYLIVIAIAFLLADFGFPHLFLLLSAALLLACTLIVRAIVRVLMRHGIRARNPLKVLMVGTDAVAQRAAYRLHRTPFRCDVVGYVHIPDQAIEVSDAPIHELAELERLDLAAVNDIVVALGPGCAGRLSAVVDRMEKFCVPIRAVVDFGEDIVNRERLFHFGRLQLLDLAHFPVESPAYTIAKRAFDIAFACLAILGISPLLLAIAIGIKLTSPGPIFFRQERVGLNGRVFFMLKFRSMKIAPAPESDTRWTVKNDPRRTRFGAWLRRTSLDELPQFFNVLRGEMSVVGPRPERPYFVKKFLQDIHTYNSRHRLKVGITGWAQVNGWRGDTSIEKRVEHDLYYLQNWSFTFDLRIIFLTIWSGLRHRNAY